MKTWQKTFFVTAATAMLTILAVTTANAAFVDNALNSVIEWISDKIWAIYELVTPAASVTSSDFMSAFAGAFPTLYFASDRIGLVGLFFALGICWGNCRGGWWSCCGSSDNISYCRHNSCYCCTWHYIE